MQTFGTILMLALVAGPRTLGGHYFGVHFVVLGAMLSLIGTNVISMGILGKIILGVSPANASRLMQRVLVHPYLLECVLATGAIIALGGLATDAMILTRWLQSATAMDDTVHMAIVASTMFVIGSELMFTAFLLFLVSTHSDEPTGRM